MKTKRDWFIETLSKEESEKAIKYTPEDIIDTESLTFDDALVDAFLWDDTEEGLKYWQDIAERINLKETYY